MIDCDWLLVVELNLIGWDLQLSEVLDLLLDSDWQVDLDLSVIVSDWLLAVPLLLTDCDWLLLLATNLSIDSVPRSLIALDRLPSSFSLSCCKLLPAMVPL